MEREAQFKNGGTTSVIEYEHNDEVLVLTLITVMTVGSVFSILAFIGEWIYYKLKNFRCVTRVSPKQAWI